MRLVQFRPRVMLLLIACVMGSGCRSPESGPPSITFDTVPQASEGGSENLAPIAGRVAGAQPGQRIVLFARSNVWWVQPYTVRPFTDVGRDSTWKSDIHLGTEYAALLVDASYRPPATVDVLPRVGGSVFAVSTVTGRGHFVPTPRKMLTFSGYEWQIRQTASDRGGTNQYDAANAWTDADGFLHLRLARRDGQWTSAEVVLTRGLGYGTYAFVLRDVSRLDPAAAIGLLTWDDLGADQNHRELDIEIGQWGDSIAANTQYVVQPYYVAANVFRFSSPGGRLTHSFRWEPGRALFTTRQGSGLTSGGRLLAQHEFTAGVPVPGSERVHMSLYYFRYAPHAPQEDVEVVIERFQYLP
jgi:hypothetical protein